MIHRLWLQFRQSFLRRWQQFTSPSVIIQNQQDQFRARLLASITLLGIVYIPLYMILRIIANDPEGPWTQTISFVILALMIVAYILSRSRYYRLGIVLLVVLLSIIALAQGALHPPIDPTALLWIVPIIFFSSLMLPLRGTALVILGEIILVALIFTFVPDIRVTENHFTFDYTIVVSLLIIFSGYLTRRYTQQIEVQARDLAESEERYRSLFESGFVGLMVHDNGVLVDANPGFLTALGYTLPEVLGKPMHQFFLPVSTASMPKLLDSTHFEMVAHRKDGSKFQVEIYRKQVNYRGRMAQVLAFHDITEHKQAEENRIKLLAERERSQVLRQFISDASHDLRTPLATINTSLYLLRKTTPEQPNIARYFDSIQAQVFHLNEVLESLLLMARLDDPDTYFDLTLLDLNQLTRNVVETVQPLALKRQQTLDFEPAADMLPVCVDGDEIKRAIRLLLDNALQYTPEGGKILIRTEAIGQEAIVEVKDNGPGISPEDLPHIFQRFYRGDKARGQTQHVGAGLGLPIARKIIETHNGKIEIATQVGQGSTFQIFLPIVIE